MKLLLTILLATALTAACFCAPNAAIGQSNPLLDKLIAALNSKDAQTLKAFVAENASNDVPAETRAQRFMGLAEQGAPFKLVRLVDANATEIKAIIEDKEHMQLGLQIRLNDAAKIKMILVGDPDEVDSPAPKDYAGWKDLPSLAEAIRSDTKAPAMALAALKDGKLETAVTGVRVLGGKDVVGADEPFSIGSIGKPICSSIIGRLIELGKLKWDTTLGDALSDLPMQDGYKSVTLEQLMHHRGGVPADPGMRRPQVQKIVAGETDPTKIRLNYAKEILLRQPIGKPGEKFEYSNAGYALLGVIAEKVTGKRYEDLIKEFVYAPLGLTHSFTAADKLPDARPSGHIKGPNGFEPENMSGPIETLYAPAGGGQFMSVSDLARFGEAHLQGLLGRDGFLKAGTIKRLHTGEPEMPGGRLYACGWGIEKFDGVPLMHTHNGSNGTMRAQVGIFPEAGLVVAAFVNCGGESQPSPPLQAILAVAKKYAAKP